VLLLALGIATGSVAAIADARPAWASCAAEPSQSPYWFTGIVVSTTNADRTAVVRTDDGRVVIVRGTDAEAADVHTSVDRTYQVGLRYEFDPVNGSSPYQDNLCSTTHPIGPSGIVAPSTGASHRLDSGIGRTAVWATGGLVAAVCAWFVGRLVRRAMKRVG
jgi:hypothetical protein